eukprot:Sspe_Gene.119807::Locus_116763_Transcript_2_3_Confidence_0.286_Length_960::g.119807::m.119807
MISAPTSGKRKSAWHNLRHMYHKMCPRGEECEEASCNFAHHKRLVQSRGCERCGNKFFSLGHAMLLGVMFQRKKCKYGESCYRKNTGCGYYHKGDEDDEDEGGIREMERFRELKYVVDELLMYPRDDMLDMAFDTLNRCGNSLDRSVLCEACRPMARQVYVTILLELATHYLHLQKQAQLSLILDSQAIKSPHSSSPVLLIRTPEFFSFCVGSEAPPDNLIDMLILMHRRILEDEDVTRLMFDISHDLQIEGTL